MPRSPQKVINWRALTLLLAFALFASFMLIEAGAQGRRSRSSQNLTADAGGPQQATRKNIVSVRSTDTSDGSRVTITSDVPLNDYEAYWGGDRFFVIIPNAGITFQNVQTLQAALRGRGFQEVRIERKGNDLVFSFRMHAGFRARPEQKFNRLDIILTAPPGTTFPTNGTGQTGTQGGGTGRPTTGTGRPNVTTGGELGGGGRTTGTGTGGAGTSGAGTSGSSGSIASTGGGGGGGRRTTGGRSRSRSGVYYGGGGGDRSSGPGVTIPTLPSEIQAAQTPSPTPLASGTPSAATTTASPTASPGTGEGTAQTTASPATTLSPTPEQIARNEPPVTAPPATSTTNTNAPAPAATTGFAAAIREYWLPLLIGLLVLGAIVLLMASRSRAERTDERDASRLQTKKQETIKDKPASRTGAAVAGGAAGAAAVAAMARESRAKTTVPEKEPVKEEETKTVEPVAPAVAMEQVGAEVKNLLEGKDYDEAVIASSNPDTRQIVSTELLAALASRNPERRLRAREAFINHGFFDEATRKLRTSATSAERISAARALGLTQDSSATAHLVAALEDDDPEVRRASVNALAELRDPSAIGPLNALLEREKNRKVPHSLIRRAIEASATIDLSEAATPTTAAPAKDTTATSAEKKDKDDDDREVFEI